MNAVAEGHVRTCFAMNIEAVTIGEATIVAIGASDHQDQRATLRNLLAVVLDVVGDIARHERAGWLEAQQFLDRLRTQFRILDDLTALVSSEERRLVKECDSTCISRWSPYI